MTGGDDPDTPEGPDGPALHGGRAWQHPSELGLATRGRADRRRSTMIASGVLLGGLGMLLTGLVLGTMDDPATATTSTLPVDRARQSVALVMDTGGDPSTAATALVLDDAGHLLVGADSVAGTDRVWAKCHTGEMQEAVVVGRDEATDLAVLKLELPRGVPVSVDATVPAPGTDLVLVDARSPAVGGDTPMVVEGTSPPGDAQFINLSGHDARQEFSVTVQSATEVAADAGTGRRGSILFDRSGRLAGVVVADRHAGDPDRLRVLAGADAVAVGEALVAARR